MSTNTGSDKLLYAVDERPPLWLAFVLGFQHVLVIYGEIVIFPLVVGRLANAPHQQVQFACFAAAIAAGICTVLQALRFGKYGSGFVIFMGSSTAYLSCSVEAVKLGGFPLLAAISILVAPLEAVLSFFIRFLRHIVTPAVGGIVLLLIVVSLLPLSIKEWVGHPGAHYASWQNLAAGLATLVVVLGLALFGNKQLRVWCPIIGMAFGFATSWILGLTHFESLHAAPWFGLPSGKWPGLNFNFGFEHLPVIAAMAVVTVINGVQAMGNSMAVQQASVNNFRKVDYDRIQGCLYVDSLGNVVSGLLGSVPNETYLENVSLLNVTGVASRLVGICGGILMCALAFSPKISGLLIEMPQPVFGGFMMGLAAMMFPAGLSLIATTALNHESGLLIGISLCIGMAAQSGYFFPSTMPTALAIFTNSAVAAGGLTAIVLSSLLSIVNRPKLSFKIDATIDRLDDLVGFLENSAGRLKLTPDAMHHLHLACEEVFVHVADTFSKEGVQEQMTFKMLKQENTLFVEIICSNKVTDVDQTAVGPAYQEISEEALGLVILRQITSDLKHVRISGTTYISFKILEKL
jgi:NCS2 family nucleobase:cation symporter-2/xanthine permease XanP